MTTVALGSVAMGFAITLYLLKKRGRFLTAMMIITGFAAAGLIGKILNPVLNAAGGLGLQIGFGTVAAAAAILWIFYEVKEKRTHKMTPWVALLLPALLLSAGLPLFTQLGATGQQIMQSGNSSVSQVGK